MHLCLLLANMSFGGGGLNAAAAAEGGLNAAAAEYDRRLNKFETRDT